MNPSPSAMSANKNREISFALNVIAAHIENKVAALCNWLVAIVRYNGLWTTCVMHVVINGFPYYRICIIKIDCSILLRDLIIA